MTAVHSAGAAVRRVVDYEPAIVAPGWVTTAAVPRPVRHRTVARHQPRMLPAPDVSSRAPSVAQSFDASEIPAFLRKQAD